MVDSLRRGLDLLDLVEREGLGWLGVILLVLGFERLLRLCDRFLYISSGRYTKYGLAYQA